MTWGGKIIQAFTNGSLFSKKKHNEIVQALNPLLNIEFAGGKVSYSDRNVFIRPNSESGSGGAGASVSTYRFKSMNSDTLVCHSWDFATEGSDNILIAKPPKLRFSIASEVIDGDTVTYSAYDTGAQTRHATDGGTSEDQVIVPRYLVDDVIYVISANTDLLDGDGNPITLLDLNIDARAWAKIT